MKTPKSFLKASENKAFSDKHRQTISFNMGKYDRKVAAGKKQFEALELARMWAKNRKYSAIEQLPEMLERFEQELTARGGKVIWAEDATQALVAIQEIVEQHQAKTVVKSKSMITEEIELNPFLEELELEVLETDLGEYIVQVREEAPYHIVTPAMHLSKADVVELFHEKFGTAEDATAEELTAFVRRLLRQQFEEADIGITGANFLIAETGSVALTENEGNARLATSLPKIHIAIAGIEKVLPKLEDLEIFWPLLSTFGTGQKLTVYNSLLNGPRQEDEQDGPEEMYVILLDNGRSNILADPKQRESLYCIRCGSCLNACPVYRTIGGHSYDAPYPGPIGSVLMPNLQGFESYGHLSKASSLCGACTENCPLNIQLHQLLVHNRAREVELASSKGGEGRIWKLWQRGMLNRPLMNAPAFGKNMMANLFLKGAWGPRRKFPKFPKHTFNQLWKKGGV
jgi:L-lactate dehydrogenase complex protein LldF